MSVDVHLMPRLSTLAIVGLQCGDGLWLPQRQLGLTYKTAWRMTHEIKSCLAKG